MARLNNTQYNLLNTYTGEYQSFNKVTTWLDGSPMTDGKCDGTIFRKKNSEYFKLNWTGPVNVKWFGAKGDGVTNDSVAVQKAIDAFRVGSQGSGQSFLFPEGVYLLDNIQVPSGTKLFADQTAKYIYIPNLHTKIIPASQSTEYVFYFEDGCINAELVGIYIEGTGYPNLKAAVRFTGNACNLEKCLFNACQQTAVLSSAGNSFIRQCGIFGWYGPAPTFTGINDFRAALQVEAMGDAYIMDNEIGAGLPYFATYPDPMDMLRDPVNRRICAMACIGFFGTSVISGNLFENGDRGVVLSGAGLYCTFHHNRYELSGGTGLTILNAVGAGGGSTYFTFIGERFSDNSLAGDGVFDDIFLTPGTAGNISFIAPIFEKLASSNIPTSNFKVKWHINNQASTTIELVSPQVDPTYALKGLINNEDVSALPVKQAVMQYDPKNPLFSTVSTQKEVVDTQTGYVKLIPGTDAGAGNLTGGVQFYDSTSTPKALLGFNANNDLWFNLNQSGGSYIFVNGPLYATKAGGNSCTINSSDSGLVAFNLSQNNGTNGTFSIDLLGDNTCIMGSDHDLTIGLVTGGSIKVSPNGKVYLPFNPGLGTVSTVSIVTRNTSTGEVLTLPSNTFAQATGGTGYIQNQSISPQSASYAINGIGRIEGGLSIFMGANPAYPLQVGNISGISGQFTGRVIGVNALNPNELATLAQVGAVSTIYTSDGSISTDRIVTVDTAHKLRFACGTVFTDLMSSSIQSIVGGSDGSQSNLVLSTFSASLTRTKNTLSSGVQVSEGGIFLTSADSSASTGVTISATSDGNISVSSNAALSINTASTKVSGKLGMLSTGAAALSGLATFPTGTNNVVVNTTAITANSIVLLSVQSYSNPTASVGVPIVSAKVAGTSFTITWGIPGVESGTVGWVLVEPF